MVKGREEWSLFPETSMKESDMKEGMSS